MLNKLEGKGHGLEPAYCAGENTRTSDWGIRGKKISRTEAGKTDVRKTNLGRWVYAEVGGGDPLHGASEQSRKRLSPVEPEINWGVDPGSSIGKKKKKNPEGGKRSPETKKGGGK